MENTPKNRSMARRAYRALIGLERLFMRLDVTYSEMKAKTLELSELVIDFEQASLEEEQARIKKATGRDSLYARQPRPSPTRARAKKTPSKGAKKAR